MTGFGKTLRKGSARDLHKTRFWELRSKFVKAQILSYVAVAGRKRTLFRESIIEKNVLEVGFLCF